MFVRRFATPDTPALYDVCLRTADGGGDATHLHDEPSLDRARLARSRISPSNQTSRGWSTTGAAVRSATSSAPSTRWRSRSPVSGRGGRVCARCTPNVRMAPRRSRRADADLVQMIHHPPAPPLRFIEDYPSHLHIDLLPEAQGAGFGRVLIETLCAMLDPDGFDRGVRGRRRDQHAGARVLPARRVRRSRHDGQRGVARPSPDSSAFELGVGALDDEHATLARTPAGSAAPPGTRRSCTSPGRPRHSRIAGPRRDPSRAHPPATRPRRHAPRTCRRSPRRSRRPMACTPRSPPDR